jgi:rod shape determining protein RodA
MIMLLLISVFVIGSATKGDKNWIDLGFFKLQPSEFSKFATAMALAAYLDMPGVKFSNYPNRWKALAIVGVPLLLILAQGDAGTCLVFLGFAFVFNKEGLPDGLLYLGFFFILISILSLAVSPVYIIAGLLLVAVSIIYMYYVSPRDRGLIRLLWLILFLSMIYSLAVNTVFNKVLEPHQKDRINVILGKVTDPDGVAYNLNQSKIAIGSGGFFGKGFLQGTQTRYNYVPEMSTDFIFSAVGEEWGFLGSTGVVLLFTILISKLLQMADRQRSAYGRVYIMSIASIFFMHFMINIGMTIGLLPVIGIPLPFMSYGGSSLMAFSFMLATAIKLDSERMMTLN